MLEWYLILLYVVGGLLLCTLTGIIVKVCCSRRSKYKKIEPVEQGSEEQESHANYETLKPSEEEKEIESKFNPYHSDRASSVPVKTFQLEKKHISNVTESTAEKSYSDVGGEDPVGPVSTIEPIASPSISAYGDTIPATGGISAYGDGLSIGSVSAYGDTASGAGSMVSVTSKASWSTTFNSANLSLSIQSSLIYSKDMRYVAGKVIQADGLKFESANHPTHVRVHVVVLPIKKYALKTNWYEIPTAGKVRIDEYFKFVFKLPPSELKTMFRLRLYGRKVKMGSLGRAMCIGECYITLLEIINARGGLTLWRTLSRGVPQAILEGQMY